MSKKQSSKLVVEKHEIAGHRVEIHKMSAINTNQIPRKFIQSSPLSTVAILLLGLLGAFAPVSADTFDDAPIPAADAIIQEMMFTQSIVGCAVGMVDDSGIFYLQGYNHREVGHPWTASTVAPVGSIAKTFTAFAIMRMAEEGYLETNRAARNYLPVGVGLWNLHIDDLLTHRAGLQRNPSWGPGPNLGAYTEEHPMAHPRNAVVEWSKYTPFTTPRGDHSPEDVHKDINYPNGSYSNAGYAALGAVVDTLSLWTTTPGYESYVLNEVLRGSEPDGSPSAVLMHSWREGEIPNLAVGYKSPSAGGGVVPWLSGPTGGWEGPPGGWAMTIGDLTRFTQAVMQREILSPASWNAVLQRRSAVLQRSYGYGVWNEENVPNDQVTRIWHGGDTDGFRAIWAVYEQDDPTKSSFGVAIQCNQVGASFLYGNSSNDKYDNIADRLYDLYQKDELVPELDVYQSKVGIAGKSDQGYNLVTQVRTRGPARR